MSELYLKQDKIEYKAEIKLDPIPENCAKCPFYYPVNVDDAGTWYEAWDCYKLRRKTHKRACGLKAAFSMQNYLPTT